VIGLSLPGGAVLSSSLATTPRPWGEQDNSGRTPLSWQGNHGYWSEYQLARPLHYVRARWYLDGGPGWLSVDPLGFEGGDWNLYRYVRNRPTVEVDPEGMRKRKGGPKSGKKGGKRGAFGRCPGLTRAEKDALPKAIPAAEATNCRAIGTACLQFIFSCQQGQGGQSCFTQFGDWMKTLTDCACQKGANPLLLLAIAWNESQWGTHPTDNPKNQPIRCHNPFSIHFNGRATGIRQLCKPDGSLPTFGESACAAAATVHKDQGVKPGVFGKPPKIKQLIQWYEEYKVLCQRASKS
jgi:RHS repeat-associated protein